MSDENEPTQGDGQEVVTEAQEAEGQVEDQTAEDDSEDPKAEKPEDAESEDEKRRKESAKERRERDKAYKQRLRDEADKAQRSADDAERRRQAIIEAGRHQQAPSRAQFDDPAEYAAARAVWEYQRQAAEREAGEATSAAQQAREQANQYELAERQIAERQWHEQVAEARARYADYDSVALTHEFPVTDVMADVIRGSDLAADILYQLGRNRTEAMRIAQLPPLAAARELGRIEAQLQAPKPRTESKAPPPVTPVKATASGAKSPDKMSADEYRQWRAQGGRF